MGEVTGFKKVEHGRHVSLFIRSDSAGTDAMLQPLTYVDANCSSLAYSKDDSSKVESSATGSPSLAFGSVHNLYLVHVPPVGSCLMHFKDETVCSGCGAGKKTSG